MSVSNKAKATTSYVIVGSQAAILGSQAVISPSGHGHRPVLVIPVLPPQPTIKPVIYKLLLKAVMKGKPKESKMFTLRNLDPNRIVSCKDLMREIQVQLSEDMTGSSFDVGFIQGNSAVSIRSNENLVEIWDLVQKGKNIVLWCDGIVLAKENRKRSARVDSDDDSEIEQKRRSKKKKKDDSVIEDKVEEMVQKLKAKHGNTTYTQMQYRIWSEMIVGGIHVSQNEHPETTMFARCGSAVSAKKRSSSNVVKAIADALSPKQNSGSNQGHSPARVIENRSRYYKQLTELKNIQVNGILTSEEYASEREAVMASLKTLKS